MVLPRRLSAVENCCIITGGAGNLASHLAAALAGRFQRLILTDIAPKVSCRIPPNAVYKALDIGNLREVEILIAKERPAAIVHLASLLSGSSEIDRRQTWHVNTTATLEILEQALKLPKCRVLFASSLATYGVDVVKIALESQSQWPSTLYGVSKVACERLGAYARQAHGLDFRCVRLPIIISRQAPAQAVSALVSRAFVESLKSGRFVFRARPEVSVASLYIKDAVLGMASILQAPNKEIRQPVYSLGGFTATLGEFSAAILKNLPKVEHTFEPDPEVEKVLSSWPAALDDTAARCHWHWRPQYNLCATTSDILRRDL